MVDDAGDLAAALLGTGLDGRRIETIVLPGAEERAFAVRMGEADLDPPAATIALWREAHARLGRTGRWPVALTSWGIDELVSPVETASGDPRPSLVRAEAVRIDAAEALAAIAARGPRIDDHVVDRHLDATVRRCGSAPAAEAILATLPENADTYALDRLLLDWEVAAGASAAADPTQREPLYCPSTDVGAALVFLPTAHGPDALAYLAFYAEDSVEGATGPRLVAVLREWSERYGAHLFAHWGTMLQFVVERPPTASTRRSSWLASTS